MVNVCGSVSTEADLTASEAVEKIGRGDLTAEALTRACLDRIAEIEDQVHAFAYLDPDLAATNPQEAVLIDMFNPEFAALLGDLSASDNISEALAFSNPPGTDALKDAITRWWNDQENAIFDDLRLDDSIPTEEIDFGYTAGTSLTASTTGGPLGDPRWFDTATSVEDATELPGTFELLGSYPNPFNPSTTIRYNLEVPAEVSVQVYDVLGRLVLQTPAQTRAPGVGLEYRIDATDWASGVYLYKVTARTVNATVSSTGSMLLVK